MLGLELTFAQKLEIGFVVFVLCIAGYLVYRGTRTSVDMTITAWGPDARKVGIDPRRPTSAKNPADPSKTVQVTTFACHDGRLEIFEYPPDSELKSSFLFIPDLTLTKRGQSYSFYKDPLARLNAISDPFKRALSIAAYNAAAGNRGLNIVNSAELDKDQAASEKDLRDRMMTQVDLMQNGAQTGTYEPEMYENVLRALTAYRAQEGDPTKNSAKAALAHKVIARAMDYLDHLQKEEAVVIDKYIDGATALLNDDQKTKFLDAANVVKIPKPPHFPHAWPAPVKAPPPAAPAPATAPSS